MSFTLESATFYHPVEPSIFVTIDFPLSLKFTQPYTQWPHGSDPTRLFRLPCTPRALPASNASSPSSLALGGTSPEPSTAYAPLRSRLDRALSDQALDVLMRDCC